MAECFLFYRVGDGWLTLNNLILFDQSLLIGRFLMQWDNIINISNNKSGLNALVATGDVMFASIEEYLTPQN